MYSENEVFSCARPGARCGPGAVFGIKARVYTKTVSLHLHLKINAATRCVPFTPALATRVASRLSTVPFHCAVLALIHLGHASNVLLKPHAVCSAQCEFFCCWIMCHFKNRGYTLQCYFVSVPVVVICEQCAAARL